MLLCVIVHVAMCGSTHCMSLVFACSVLWYPPQGSDFTQHLMDVGPGVNVTVKNSGRQDLPSASLKRFLKEGIANANGNFAGSVLTSFNDSFQNRCVELPMYISCLLRFRD